MGTEENCSKCCVLVGRRGWEIWCMRERLVVARTIITGKKVEYMGKDAGIWTDLVLRVCASSQ